MKTILKNKAQGTMKKTQDYGITNAVTNIT